MVITAAGVNNTFHALWFWGKLCLVGGLSSPCLSLELVQTRGGGTAAITQQPPSPRRGWVIASERPRRKKKL